MTTHLFRSGAILALIISGAFVAGCDLAKGPDSHDGAITVPAAAHGDPASAPVQPIDYRHSIHAGQLKIPCLYCHNNADKSPIANVPAVSTCMNCHRIVAGSNPTYQKEIAKVVDYYNRGQAIPWVSVYRLPDHAWFSHKRHVKAGMQCQTCHGPVQQMDHVYKYSSLKMGWCVTCHKANLHNAQFASSIDCYTCHK